MRRILDSVGDRLLARLVPKITARATPDFCWWVQCGSGGKWWKLCCSDGLKTWCYQCQD
jgi:hypothetical protein